MKKIKLSFLFLLIFLVGFTVSYFLIGYKNSNKFYLNGWNDAKLRYEKYKMFEERDYEENVFTIIGKVSELKDSKIYLKIAPISPFDAPDLDNRIIIIDNQTSLLKSIKKNNEVYQNELTTFYKKNPEMKTRPDAIGIPTPFTSQKISIDDFLINQRIKVISSSNVRFQKEFTAKEILILGN
jgi:hypothetical protein